AENSGARHGPIRSGESPHRAAGKAAYASKCLSSLPREAESRSRLRGGTGKSSRRTLKQEWFFADGHRSGEGCRSAGEVVILVQSSSRCVALGRCGLESIQPHRLPEMAISQNKSAGPDPAGRGAGVGHRGSHHPVVNLLVGETCRIEARAVEYCAPGVVVVCVPIGPCYSLRPVIKVGAGHVGSLVIGVRQGGV